MTTETYYIQSTKYSLQERQTKKGKVYDVVFRVIDKVSLEEKQKKLSGFTTKTLAKSAHDDFILKYCEMIKDTGLAKKVKNQKAEPTFDELAQIYISTLANQNKESSIYDKKNIFKNYLSPMLGDKKIKDLTVQVLYQWQDELWSMTNPKTKEYYSYKYLCNVRINLSAFLNWCETRYGTINNLKRVTKPKRRTPKTEMQIWTREEFDNFIKVVDDPFYHCFFTMLFFTGRRKGEVIALNKSDIKDNIIIFNKTYSRKTLQKGTYNITATKNEKRFEVPICEPLRKELDTYKGNEPFFFGGENPKSEHAIANAFQRYTELSKNKPIRIHDLRHSFVSMCISLGATIPVVADLIGDTQEQVMKTYAHLYGNDKQEIMNKIH